MTEEEERLFNSLEVMRAARWNSFDQRRSYEWKFCIALWTALAVFDGTLIREHPCIQLGKFHMNGAGAVLASLVFTVLIVGIHAYWSVQLMRRNDSDRDAADLYEERMCNLVHVSAKTDLEPLAGKLHRRKGRRMGYSHQVQVIVTAILATIADLALLGNAC